MDVTLNSGRTVRKQPNLYRICKRGQDVLLSALALLVLWPILLLIAAAVVLDNPGAGPIFAQTRIGLNGTPFTLYKFRTMHPNAEAELPELLQDNEMNGPVFKIRCDPRITRVGRFLRRSGLDELPQLWNVLRGEMSLVGPRPGLPREVALYDGFARQRLSVLPGLTCFWQIRPDRYNLRFEEWMALDARYLREQSVWTDWKIMLATIGAMLRMNGQ